MYLNPVEKVPRGHVGELMLSGSVAQADIHYGVCRCRLPIEWW